jgi:hypothetical protein
VVSLDGGKTFSAPVSTGAQAFETWVAGLTPGVAVVITNGPFGVSVTRSEDAGVSWSLPRVLNPQGGSVRVTAAGNRVAIALQPGNFTQLFTSSDGGLTFVDAKTTLSARDRMLGLGIDADGIIWTALSNGLGLVLRKSTDGGTTFDAGTQLPGDVFAEMAVFGPKSVFAAGKQPSLLVAPLDKPAEARSVPGLGDIQMFPRLLVPDQADGVAIIDSSNFGTDLTGRRLGAGAPSFSAPKSLGSSTSFPSAAALNEKAIAVVTIQGSQVLVGVTTW